MREWWELIVEFLLATFFAGEFDGGPQINK